ncbi:MAG: hypothetical protein IIA67_02820 [Planctomycetes bacterium]|nr:hypothetical protein [Planctomycetota bacterium]
MDLFPPIVDAAGAKVSHEIDGRSIMSTLLGKPQEEFKRDLFFTRREGGARYGGKTIDAVRRGPWKLLQNSPWEPLELYNLVDDPLEKNNLAAKNRRVFNELSAALRAQIQRGGAISWQRPDSP